MAPRTVPLAEVAQALGISCTTVCRALSGKGRVSEETRRRVREYLVARGYGPEAFGQPRAKAVALVMPAEARDPAALHEQVCAACSAAEQAGFGLLLVQGGGAVRQTCRAVYGSGALGALVAGHENGQAIAEALQRGGMPCALLGGARQKAVPQAAHDHGPASGELAALLLMRGVRKIGLLGLRPEDAADVAYREGVLQACGDAGLTAEAVLLPRPGGGLAPELDALLAQDPEALLCADGPTAREALCTLRERGIRVPEQLFLASLRDHPCLEAAGPAVTAVRYDDARLGEAAMRLLLGQLEGQPPAAPAMPGWQIVLRDSTRR